MATSGDLNWPPPGTFSWPWTHRDSDGIGSFRATLATDCGTATTEVWDSGNALAALFRELGEAIGGFAGEREYTSLEGQLSLRCAHVGRGTVGCAVTLARL